MVVQQHDEIVRMEFIREYGCAIAPSYTGKKEAVTPPFHLVALVDASSLNGRPEFVNRFFAMPQRLQFALPMLQSGTVLMSENIPYVQLQMVLPRARFATLPAPHLPPGYTLRTFQPGDESEFLRVLNLQDWGAWTPERLQPWLERIVPESWYMSIHQADGQLAATAMGLDDSSDLHPSGGELGWVAADPAHRGKGLGTAVCAAATARLIQAGYREVHLYTEHWRLPAIHIYFKLGYVPLLHLPEMYERWRVICDQLGRSFEPEAWIAALERDG